MFKFMAFGIAAGAGFQAWRNYPADGPTDTDMLWVVLVAGMLAAYLGGRWHGHARGGATAVAVATAEATATAGAAAHNQVQVINVVPRVGVEHYDDEGLVWQKDTKGRPIYDRRTGIGVPSDNAPWMDGGRPALELDQLDGVELTELLEDREVEA